MAESEQPAPKITKNTILLSLDVESNGLHGPAFAVGAVLIKCDGTILDEFSGRAQVRGEVDPWVKKKVLPALQDMPIDHKSAKELRSKFWDWFKAAKDRADYVMVDNGYPVEARFLISCQDDDIENRQWDHAYPMLELASALIQIGVKPLAVRRQLVADEIGDAPVLQHHPRFDAWVSALAMIKAFKLSGRLEK